MDGMRLRGRWAMCGLIIRGRLRTFLMTVLGSVREKVLTCGIGISRSMTGCPKSKKRSRLSRAGERALAIG
jgi:hypothetical protein